MFPTLIATHQRMDTYKQVTHFDEETVLCELIIGQLVLVTSTRIKLYGDNIRRIAFTSLSDRINA